MKILWMCNVLIPRIARCLNANPANTGGWLTGLSNELTKNSNVELTVCFPHSDEVFGVADDIKYYGFKNPNEENFIQYIHDFRPDIIHIFGTEYEHSYRMLCASDRCNLLDKTVVSIQGMVSVYANHFYANLPWNVVHGYTLRDLIKRNNIYCQRKDFIRRGKFEEMALALARNVIGRTDWDEALVKRINPYVNYFKCNETLRTSFYSENEIWSLDNCQRHSIFVSQCGYPIKGYHYMIDAMKDLVKEFPDAILYTTGIDLLNLKGINRLKKTYYQHYLVKLIKKNKLENNVVFLGSLNEKEMRDRYLKSHIFVCCSSIENSPNSLGEAMILGTPCVSSDVGGVKNMMQHEREGFIYPSDEPYMCAFYIKKIFSDSKLAINISENGRAHADNTHNVITNNDTLLSIYNQLCYN